MSAAGGRHRRQARPGRWLAGLVAVACVLSVGAATTAAGESERQERPAMTRAERENARLDVEYVLNHFGEYNFPRHSRIELER